MLLTIHALGLGAVWIGAFYEDQVNKILKVPEYVRAVAIIPIGHPDTKSRAPPRIPLDEITYLDFYGNGFTF